MKDSTSERAESLYNHLISYHFARPYLKGRSVAHISWAEAGSGVGLLSDTAESVTFLVGSAEASNTQQPQSNVDQQRVMLPDLPYPDDYFDAVVALEAVERLEDPKRLLAEIKRVLKPNGILVLSTPDKQAYSNDRNFRDPAHRRELYVPELRESLEQLFEHVELYQQGAVAGGLVVGPKTASRMLVEAAGFSFSDAFSSEELPVLHHTVAVCSDAVLPELGERPGLLLDRDQLVFDERDGYREDVELLRAEIEQMQRTEVQAFRDALKTERGRAAWFEARLDETTNRTKILERKLRATEKHLRATEDRLRAIEGSRTWWLLGHLRRARNRLASAWRFG